MPTPVSSDPRFAEVLQADAALTAPGAPFEIVVEPVLGEAMPVFARRPRSLRDVLLRGADSYGERDVYVWSDGRRATFSSIVAEVAEVAAGLRSVFGIGRGDRVAICAANCPEWLSTFWACASLGAVAVAMNGWWSEGEMRNALELTGPSVVIMDEKRHARLGGVDPSAPTIVIERSWPTLAYGRASELPSGQLDEDDPFELIFTSGTTGRPKAAVLSHRSVVSYLMVQAYAGARASALSGRTPGSTPVRPPTRLATFPMFHVSGLSNAVGSMMSGATTVWPLGRFDAGTVIELTKREGINGWGGGTTHIVRLLDHPEIATVDPQQLVSVGVGGSATPPALIDRIEETFPHLTGTTSSGYGSTETGLLSHASNWMLRLAPDTVGPVLPTVSIRITDETGAEVADGEAGHIEARSWQSMLEYWENPAANAETIRPGRWIRTGDFGRLERGVLSIASRLRDLIIRGGENIYPFEIEHRVEEHPGVVEAAVFGIESSVYGQDVKAVVVVRDDAVGEEELRAFCGEALASYKVPAVIELRVDPLPRNATGKVLKHVLAGAENTFVEE